MTIDDVLGAELEAGRAVPTAVAGEPYESWKVISDDGRVELGVWEVTPGSFEGSCEGYYEQMHFVAGRGTITDADGVVTSIGPGVVMLCPDGWSGVWAVDETVRKTYAIVKIRLVRWIDPLERWRELGLPDKPDYAGLLTYAGMPFTQDAAELAGVDVAIVGAPTDDLVSDRPGTRFGPRAIRAASCPPGPHLEAKVDAFEELRIVDFGDAAVVPADPERTHAQIERTVGQAVAAGAIPVVLGGDHSITEPNVRAVAARHGPVGLVHFDTHTDTGNGGLRRRALTRNADVPARPRRPRRRRALRADRPARLLAGRGGVLVAARARDHVVLHARRA